ncbi:hypothetical protein MHA02_30660 [Methylobacterium haplocladii]|uniref:Uncharacterized protein n=1 Tax=Methylobacterium haplocladii TaxID=1176176 RepID=A0A512ISS1_9HYPH|nr:hypothetical protein MHA02_30660 [Methylobacterium haplocladii]
MAAEASLFGYCKQASALPDCDRVPVWAVTKGVAADGEADPGALRRYARFLPVAVTSLGEDR